MRRGFPPPRPPRGQERRRGPRYLTGRVGVEHFAFDDEPELLPVPLALLTPAEVAADGGALSRGGHLAEGRKRGGQGSRGGCTRFRRSQNDTARRPAGRPCGDSCLQDCCPLAVSQMPGSRLKTPKYKTAGIYLGESFFLINLILRLFSLPFSYILRGGPFFF